MAENKVIVVRSGRDINGNRHVNLRDTFPHGGRTRTRLDRPSSLSHGVSDGDLALEFLKNERGAEIVGSAEVADGWWIMVRKPFDL